MLVVSRERCPEEEGTETAFSAIHLRETHRRERCPEEEGTETEYRNFHNVHTLVANVAPKKRGLKRRTRKRTAECAVDVANVAPKKRGLKLSAGGIYIGRTRGRERCPEEEGTETEAFRRWGKTGRPQSRTLPRRRGD